MTLSPLDHLVIVAYLVLTLVIGLRASRRRGGDDEYFLGSRRMPWFLVGLSLIATLLSSLTYLSEPGEVWQSGVTHMWGKTLAVPFEMLFVYVVCIPFLMRFRYTSAYEYLEHRFGPAARRLGTALFVCLDVCWMGVIVLVSSRTLAHVTGMDLVLIIGTMGLVTTIYTTIGGNRAVIWTDVAQLALLVGGALLPIGYVAYQTHTFIPDWFRAVNAYRAQAQSGVGAIPLVSLDPFVRTSVLTVALHMFVWHICTHTGNQMSVQRFFSTPDLKGARRSFVVASLTGVVVNLLLLAVGLAIFYYYHDWLGRLPEGITPGAGGGLAGKRTDLIFPTFVVRHLPSGLAGAVIAAVLGAAMSTISAGISALATVVSVGANRNADRSDAARTNHVAAARWLTAAMGLLITFAAYGLDRLTGDRNIVELMPSSFNCFTGSLGGLFFVGMFLPRANCRVAVVATLCGLAVSVAIAYSQPLSGLAAELCRGIAPLAGGLGGGARTWLEALAPRLVLRRPISFTWVMPASLSATLGVAFVLSRFSPRPSSALDDLTWSWRRRGSLATLPLAGKPHPEAEPVPSPVSPS